MIKHNILSKLNPTNRLDTLEAKFNYLEDSSSKLSPTEIKLFNKQVELWDSGADNWFKHPERLFKDCLDMEITIDGLYQKYKLKGMPNHPKRKNPLKEGYTLESITIVSDQSVVIKKRNRQFGLSSVNEKKLPVIENMEITERLYQSQSAYKKYFKDLEEVAKYINSYCSTKSFEFTVNVANNEIKCQLPNDTPIKVTKAIRRLLNRVGFSTLGSRWWNYSLEHLKRHHLKWEQQISK